MSSATKFPRFWNPNPPSRPTYKRYGLRTQNHKRYTAGVYRGTQSRNWRDHAAHCIDSFPDTAGHCSKCSCIVIQHGAILRIFEQVAKCLFLDFRESCIMYVLLDWESQNESFHIYAVCCNLLSVSIQYNGVKAIDSICTTKNHDSKFEHLEYSGDFQILRSCHRPIGTSCSDPYWNSPVSDQWFFRPPTPSKTR